MKSIRLFKSLIYATLLGIVLISFSSCNDDDESTVVTFGTVTGTVTHENGQPVSDVQVTISGVNEEDATVLTSTDGTYSFDHVSQKVHAVEFSKEGLLTVSATINVDDFVDGVAKVDMAMLNASASITGKVIDGKSNGTPLQGVTVSIGSGTDVTTGADGVFTISNLVVADYVVTFTKGDYTTIIEEVSSGDFVDGVVTLNIEMGSTEVLRGLTVSDLMEARKWYYNEYRGGRNGDAYPHWDWACDYMCTLDFIGNWEEQNEGTTLRIRNDEEEQSNPVDLDMFDSYTYGSKLITEDNKILSLRIRTHAADEAAPAYFGVQVVDLSVAEPVAVKVGEIQTYGSSDYADFEFDLSEYVGKEVIIAVGIYRQQTGDYWKQLVLRAIRFSDQKVESWNWLPGDDAISGWHLPIGTVRSTMPQIKSSFTGISPIRGDRGNYFDAYRAWRDVDHIGAEWSFVPLKKDPEVFASQGYVIKTRNTPEVDTNVPESYLYAKFNITSGNDQLTLKARNFSGSSYTYFKITAIENNGTVTHLQPVSNTAEDASAAENGTWKFIHEAGSVDEPDAYAAFVYDLSEFDGKEVTIALGVYNGVAESGENKLSIHSIQLN